SPRSVASSAANDSKGASAGVLSARRPIGDDGARGTVVRDTHPGSTSLASSFPPGKTTAPPRKPALCRSTQNTCTPPAGAPRTTPSRAPGRGAPRGGPGSGSTTPLRPPPSSRCPGSPPPRARLEPFLHRRVLHQPPGVVLGRGAGALERQRECVLGVDG